MKWTYSVYIVKNSKIQELMIAFIAQIVFRRNTILWTEVFLFNNFILLYIIWRIVFSASWFLCEGYTILCIFLFLGFRVITLFWIVFEENFITMGVNWKSTTHIFNSEGFRCNNDFFLFFPRYYCSIILNG